MLPNSSGRALALLLSLIARPNPTTRFLVSIGRRNPTSARFRSSISDRRRVDRGRHELVSASNESLGSRRGRRRSAWSYLRVVSGAVALILSSGLAQENVFPSSGSVGIGTNSPGDKLHVRGGGLYIEDAATRIWFGPSGGANYLESGNFAWNGSAPLYLGGFNNTVGPLLYSSFNTTAMMGGRVGVGTSSPWALLDVAGGDLCLRDTPGQQGYRLKSYANGDSLWIIPTNAGAPKLILGSTHSWDNQIALEYSPGTIGSSSGALTVGQVWKNSDGWTHGVTRFLTSGSERVRIDPNGYVGIGSINPLAPIHVVGGPPMTAGWNRTAILQSTFPVLGFNATGDKWAGIGYDPGWAMRFWIGGTSSDIPGSSRLAMSITDDGYVGIGTASPTHNLAVNGTVKAKEVIVETAGWSDYVFADDYRLAPLSEVEAHIRAERRLPGIPSEHQVAEHGVSVGEMQAKLLAKIEELTLYSIAADAEKKALQRANEALEERVARLEAALAKMGSQ